MLSQSVSGQAALTCIWAQQAMTLWTQPTHCSSKMAEAIIEKRLAELKAILKSRRRLHKETVMIGRTHGQHALPITLGFKFAVWGYEVDRHLERLQDCKKRIIGWESQRRRWNTSGVGRACRSHPGTCYETARIASSRNLHADCTARPLRRTLSIYAMVASSLENFATEIRELQRPEIAELFEAFEAKKQVGSSTMPHKQNPETCERVCGLARIIRSLSTPALEDMVTWHERDLTQSSAERFILPESNILIDYILSLMCNIVANLRVDRERMLMNLSLTQGRAMSESVMMALAKKGVNRQEAHELLRQLTIKSAVEKKHFKQILQEDKLVNKTLTENEIDQALDPENYLGTAVKQAEKFAKGT